MVDRITSVRRSACPSGAEATGALAHDIQGSLLAWPLVNPAFVLPVEFWPFVRAGTLADPAVGVENFLHYHSGI